MSNQETQNTVIVSFLTFIVGALAGAVTALLFAPVSGQEMRAKLKEGAEEGWDTASTQWNTARDQMMAYQAEKLEQVKVQLDELQARHDTSEGEEGA
jgi:gas vesicle protein